ncbi:hypothetical protein fugu_017739 [Takifugu bimaculatus]|uniref:Uncharacterized protein n=1 Tax=Takifugu bimaculatus TaxID=433685 RepID=A0A4Z2BUG4_9TELE|nr:hypothetical protein fugu_017739 [Takifugu bimaculatus]
MCLMAFILAWVSMATPMLCQTEEWGSGLDVFSVMTNNYTIQVVGDEPHKTSNSHEWFTSADFSSSSSPRLQAEHQLDRCSVHFSTSSRRLKADNEQLAYMHTVQHGNKAVMDNLLQFVGAELGDERYEDVIKENIIGIQEDQKTCHEVVKKAEDDMQEQLEGEAVALLTGMKKIREESKAFEDMLHATIGIADRLEISSKVLQSAFTKQLKDIAKIHR